MQLPVRVPVVSVKLTVPGRNPVPLAERTVPTGPEAGERVSVADTVKVAEAEEAPEVAVTVSAP